MDMWWDIQNHVLVQNGDDGGQIQRLDWVLRDLVAVDLYVCTPSNDDQGYTKQQAPTGWFPKFGIKHEDSLTGDALVYEGTWAYDAANKKYTATIDLNTSALIAAAGEVDYDIVAEFVLQNASARHRDTTQIACRISPDVNRGNETDPTSYYYPLMEEFVCSNGLKCLRFKNSDGQIIREEGPPGATIP